MVRTCTALLAVILAVGVLDAAKPAPDIAVNLWFDNAAGQAITSDGLFVTSNAVTADYINGLENVLAVILGAGNFRFTTQANTRQAASRTVCVDFGDQYPGALPFGTGGSRQCVNVLEAMISFGTTTTAVGQLRYGQSVQKLVRWQWSDGGYYYRLGYGSDMNENGSPDSPPVTVTCVEDSGSACTKWVLTPAPGADFTTEASAATASATGGAAFYRARILKNGESPGEILGYYTMPFSQSFTRK